MFKPLIRRLLETPKDLPTEPEEWEEKPGQGPRGFHVITSRVEYQHVTYYVEASSEEEALEAWSRGEGGSGYTEVGNADEDVVEVREVEH